MSEKHVVRLSGGLRLDVSAARLAAFDDTVESMDSLAVPRVRLAAVKDQGSKNWHIGLRSVNAGERTR